MIDAHYDTDEGEFVDFATLDDWRARDEEMDARRDEEKDARIAALEAQLADRTAERNHEADVCRAAVEEVGRLKAESAKLIAAGNSLALRVKHMAGRESIVANWEALTARTGDAEKGKADE